MKRLPYKSDILRQERIVEAQFLSDLLPFLGRYPLSNHIPDRISYLGFYGKPYESYNQHDKNCLGYSSYDEGEHLICSRGAGSNPDFSLPSRAGL